MTRKFLVAAVITAAVTSYATFFDKGSAIGAEITLMASAATRGPLRELAPQFERATGHKVVMDVSQVAILIRRIDAGATFDVVILSPTLIDDLIKQGKVAADTRAAIGRAGLGVGVPKGAPKPDISSVEALKRTLLNAKLIAYTAESESGIEFLEVLDRLGLAQKMRSKVKAYPGGAGAFGKGEADMVVTSIGSILAAPGADLVGGFPHEIQIYHDFVAGVSATAKEPEAAKALLRFLVSPTATPVFKAKGLERN